MDDTIVVVDELVEVLDRFAEISESATGACEVPDVPAIERAIEAREIVLNRARELAPMLGGSPLPPEIRNRLVRLQRADRELGDALARAHERNRVSTSEVGRQMVRVGGYAAAVPRFRRLDIKR
jgi:hypothetical protein